MFITSYIKRAAFAWLEHHVREWLDYRILIDQKKRTIVEYYLNLLAFRAKLVELYSNNNKKRTAERKLNNLEQTRTVSHYLS